MQKIKNIIKKYPYISIAVLVALVAFVGIAVITQIGKEDVADTNPKTRSVTTVPVSQYASGAVGFFVPTAAGDSFVVRAESSGRVNSTSVIAGNNVASGEVLARIDSGSQLAALTQAEGVYESALANAQQSGVTTESAENDLVSTYRSAYTTANNVLLTSIDDFFANPTFGQTPGLQISGNVNTSFLNNERIAFRDIMKNWQKNTTTISSEDNLLPLSDKAVIDMQRMIDIIDIFITLINKQDSGATVDDVSVISYLSIFSTNRTSLVSAISSIKTAQQSLNKAQLSGTGSSISSSNAQVKQALGSLQAAQSAYEKTLIRAPFAGTVTSLNVSVGDIISVGTDVVIIAPESDEDTEQSFSLPLSAVKYTPTGTFVFSVNAEGLVETVSVDAGLVTTNSVTVTGLTGNEVIVQDVRGLKAGEKVTSQ